MSKKSKNEQDEKDEKTLTAQEQIMAFLKVNKDAHLNFEEEVYYKVPSGSLKVDVETGGGFTPGLHRFCGMNEGGKTSAAIDVAENFLKSAPNPKVVLIKAEGRLSKEMQARKSLKFVTNPEEWVENSVFVLECNVFEVVSQFMKNLVFNNPNKHCYMFILDSVDGLILKNDLAKTEDEAVKVAGGALLMADLMKRMALKLSKLGHMAIFISQVRSDIKIDPYEKRPVKQTTASGGNAALHYANWILEFEARFNGDLILENEKAKYDPMKNKIIGHWAKITVKKSPNEKTNTQIRYPIKYGRKGSSSIWKEYEIKDLLLQFGHMEAGGAWINASMDSELIKACVEKFGERFQTKINGNLKLFAFLEENPDITEFLFQEFKKVLSS